MKKLTTIPDREEIIRTHEAIRHMIHRTPVLTCKSLNEMTGAELYFKCENFQKIGAFKMRGASSAALRLTEEEKKFGLATHSSGNHAQAVAKSAQMLGIPAYIVMPENAPTIKKKATRGYGAEIIYCEPTLEARETTLEKVVGKTGATFIHPYNDYNVIAGQATCAKELIEDVEESLDIIMSPIGGGGLMSGTALSSRFFSPGTKVFGAEPEAVNDAYRSFKGQELLFNTTTDTIADGLKTNLGDKTFDIILREVNEIVTVSEVSIVEAMRHIWERMKIIIEPSCAVPLAAVFTHSHLFEGKKVGIILTGGNVDVEKLPF